MTSGCSSFNLFLKCNVRVRACFQHNSGSSEHLNVRVVDCMREFILQHFPVTRDDFCNLPASKLFTEIPEFMPSFSLTNRTSLKLFVPRDAHLTEHASSYRLPPPIHMRLPIYYFSVFLLKQQELLEACLAFHIVYVYVYLLTLLSIA